MVAELRPGPQGYSQVHEQYLTQIRRSAEFAMSPIWEHTCNFLSATGLLIWDTPTSDDTIDIPALDGSFAL